MHWFGGSIAEAVTLSKQRNAIFVVFVEGDNELSTEMSSTIDDSDVLNRLSNEANFLAVKLKSGSTNYTHFAQIYQFVPVPSLFFIGRNGTPLEVVCAGVQPTNLATRIDRILQEHHKDNPSTVSGVQPSTSTQNIREQTTNFLQMEATSNAVKKPAPEDIEPEASSAKIQKTEHNERLVALDHEVICEGDVCVRRPRAEAGPSQAPPQEDVQESNPVAVSESTASIEDKLEKAKELIEARRREKAEQEKELEQQKELERRAAGQGVAELKRWQADQELKHIQEERKREKLENNLARQRILEQIAQDRAERRARDQPPAPTAAPAPAPTAAPSPAPTAGDAHPRARVQFKLPDGTSHTAHFDADGTLGLVQRYVADNLQLSASSFSLWTAFPRRELTEPEATLRSLQLAPSAALLVLPRAAPAPLARPAPLAALLAFFTQFFASYILEPSQQMFAWLCARLWGGAAGGGGTGGSGAGGGGPAPRPPPPRAPRSPAALRRRGYIHRLPGEQPNDDDNNTWNGNSTQQM